jgi:hypothetical protein
MRTSALARVAATLIAAGTALVLAAPGSQAALPDPDAPVVTNDTVALYPQGMAVVDVLANDTDPSDPDGSSLALCRLPKIDLDDILGSGNLPAVIATDAGGILGSNGTMMVMTTRSKLAKPQVIDYYVCNLTRLTPATLTVTMRATKPVTVRKVAGKPGRLKVTNHNDRRVVLEWSGGHYGGAKRVGAHKSRIIHVRGKTVKWHAVIGSDLNSGLADRGIVHHVKVDPDDKSKPTKEDLVEFPDGFFRDFLDRLR